MGYSVYITTDKNTRDKFFDFLDVNMKSINKEVLNLEANYHLLTKDPSYSIKSKLSKIGFDYNCTGAEHTYIFLVAKWMSSKINKDYIYWDHKKIEFSTLDVRTEIQDYVKFLRELAESQNKKYSPEELYNMALQNKLGLIEEHYDDFIFFISNEIDRLDELWNNL